MSEFILYQADDGQTRIQCRFENETLWLTQAQIAEDVAINNFPTSAIGRNSAVVPAW